MSQIDPESPPGRLLRCAAVAAPAALLSVAWFRSAEEATLWFGMGAAAAMALAVATIVLSRGLPNFKVAIFAIWPFAWLSVAAAALLSSSETGSITDWYVFALCGLLPLPVLALVSAFIIRQSGAMLIQHARRVAYRLVTKSDWPGDLPSCLDLPIVQEFRDAICFDATPAIQLLSNPRPQVRLSALAALERRPVYRTGQMERIVALLRKETQPEVLAAALKALVQTHEIRILEVVLEYLKHPSKAVRYAAAEVLLRESKSRRRWNYVRLGVHDALADNNNRDSGPALPPGQRLHPDAVEDFMAWCTERGVLGTRASQTVAAHFAQLMAEQPREFAKLVRGITQDVNRPAELRVALARLLCDRGYADPQLLEGLMAAVNPAPLRLLAADALLQRGPHMRSIACLREIGRVPNRELSLVTADVVQRRLGIDMGLPMGQDLPAVNSSRAVEIQRRLITWSSKIEHSQDALDTNFPAFRQQQAK